MSDRIAEYFITVGYGNKLEPIDSASPSAPLHPRSFIDGVYKCRVIDRYPLVDNANIPLPTGVAMFALPDDIRLTTSPSLPVFYTFAATQANGIRLYGACLKFVESLPDDYVRQLNDADKQAQDALNQQLIIRDTDNNTLNTISATGLAVPHSAPVVTTEDSDDADSIRAELEKVQQMLSQHNISPDEPFTPPNESLRLSAFLNSQPSTPMTHTYNEQSRNTTINSELSPCNTHNDYQSVASTDNTLQLPSNNSPHRNSEPPLPRSHQRVNSNTLLAPTNILARTQPFTTPMRYRANSVSRRINVDGTVIKPNNTPRTVYAPKCICILSAHPFIKQFREFLTELYRTSLTPMSLPIERYICNFMNEIPLPPLGELRVQYNLNTQVILFSRAPLNNPLLFYNYPIKLLFELLDLNNILILFEAILCERKLLLLSNKISLLSIVAQIIITLIYPFQWPHVYIPLLPRALADFLNAPMPFIMGIHGTNILNTNVLSHELLQELIIVDLDNNSVQARILPPQLPSRERKKIIRQISILNLYKIQKTQYEQYIHTNYDLAYPMPPDPEAIDPIIDSSQISSALSNITRQNIVFKAELFFRKNSDSADEPVLPTTPQQIDQYIVQCYFRIFLSLLRNYTDYITINKLNEPIFDTNRYLFDSGLNESNGYVFLYEFCNTQSFQLFIQQQSNDITRNQFFDEMIIEKQNRNFSAKIRKKQTKFLNETKYDITKQITVPSPDTSGLDDTVKEYIYDRFPQLNTTLYVAPRMAPRIINNDKFINSTTKRRIEPQAVISNIQVIYALWFQLFIAVFPTQHNITLLNQPFQVLQSMYQQHIQPDYSIFERLMLLCGTARQPERALDCLTEIERFGYTASATTYSTLLNVFSMNSDHKNYRALLELKKHKHDSQPNSIQASPVYNKRATMPTQLPLLSKRLNETFDTNNNSNNLPASPNTKSPDLKSRQTSQQPSNITSPVSSANMSPLSPKLASLKASESIEYKTYQQQFSTVFPELTIETYVTCPECNRSITDRAIRAGWTSDANDYTTKCPSCNNRFIARFSVHRIANTVVRNNTEISQPATTIRQSVDLSDIQLQSPSSSVHTDVTNTQPIATPTNTQPNDTASINNNGVANSIDDTKVLDSLNKRSPRPINTKLPKTIDAVLSPHSGGVVLCEYLSPIILQKEYTKLLKLHDATYILSKTFRLHTPALFWNSIWHFTNYQLPVDFLLLHYFEHTTHTNSIKPINRSNRSVSMQIEDSYNSMTSILRQPNNTRRRSLSQVLPAMNEHTENQNTEDAHVLQIHYETKELTENEQPKDISFNVDSVAVDTDTDADSRSVSGVSSVRLVSDTNSVT